MVGRTSVSTRWRALVAGVAALLLGPLLALAAPASAGGPPPPPTPTATPARANDAANIYGIGDSISTATGTGNLGAETPANSWITGSTTAVNSMRNRLGIPQASAVTLASNGRRMQDFDDQANQLPASAAYVVVELGGNDLCRPSVGEMTSVAEYRTQLRNGLAAVRANAPNALVFVASIPDIYNLWYLRGAQAPYNTQPSGRRSGLNGAHFYWDNPIVDIIPCQSLVAAPTDSSAGATARRLAVRQRNIDFNQVLAEECNAVLRCRYDGGQLFEFSSNRIDPYANAEPGPNGYLPRNQWQFVDDHISFNRGTFDWLCPGPGVIGGGTVCGDHFHPSLEGQGKLAEAGHVSSFQFGDNSFPDPALTPQRGPDGAGVYAGPVDVDVTATDDVGVRGFEHRVHHANGTVDPWTEHIGPSFTVPVADEGTTHVEARAMDVNGNLSASEWTTVTVDADAFVTFSGTVLEEGSGDPLSGVTVELHAAGTEGVVATDTTDGAGAFSFAGLHEADGYKLHVVDGDASHLAEWAQNESTHAAAATFMPTDTPEVRLTPVPTVGLAVEKVATDDVVAAGSPISWEITVSNPGEATLTGFEVEDTTATACEQAVPDLAQGESHVIECDQPTLATDEGVVSNTVSVTADQIGPVEASASTTVCRPEFSDVSGSHPFFLDVCWLVAEGITTGFQDGTYRPSSPVSRQAMAAFLYRLAGEPEVDPPEGGPTFSDVGATHPFFAEIEWAAAEGIISGFGDGTFKPANAVSRQAMAAFMFRMVDPVGFTPPGSPTFTDVPAGHAFLTEIEWLRSTGITTGFGDGTFRPGSPVTRQSMAAFLHRLAPLVSP